MDTRINARGISERIVALAKARGVSLRELARQSGLGDSQVGSIVARGRKNPNYGPDINTLRKIARGGRTSVEWLISGQGDVANVADAGTHGTAANETRDARPANASEIARRIQEIARERGWTLREFARRANLPSGYVGTLVSRIRRTPNTGIEAETLRKIANGARVSLEWLVSGDGERDAATLTASDAITAAEALRLVETIEPQLLRALVRMRPAARDALLAMLEAL